MRDYGFFDPARLSEASLLRFSYSTLELHLYVKRLRSVGRLVQQQHRVALDRVGFVAVGIHHARWDDRNGVLREAVRHPISSRDGNPSNFAGFTLYIRSSSRG